MIDRPEWAKALTHFLNDDIMDVSDWPKDDSADWVLDLIQGAVDAVLCNTYGHEITDDMCMKPEHRFCVWCLRRETALSVETAVEFLPSGEAVIDGYGERLSAHLRAEAIRWCAARPLPPDMAVDLDVRVDLLKTLDS